MPNEAPMNTAKDLAALIEKHRAEWPADLLAKAEQARMALWEIENNPAHVIEVMKEQAPNAWGDLVRRLMAFAEAYGAWSAKQ